VLGAFRRTGWRLEGTFWGLPVIAFAFALATVTNAGTAITIGIYGHYPSLLHNGIPVFCYGVGAVLLFGGTRLLKAAILPLLLLLMIDPVPTFVSRIDLPLQELSANTARAFAHLIGLKPTGEELRMMFAPDFGMLIVPGCNGMRGASTLAYLALFAGYAKGMSKRALAVFAVSALLFGYALNLLRLCVLVVYYRVGLSVTSIQSYGAQVDYVIGCTLFLIATFCIGLSLHLYGRRRQVREVAASSEVEAAPVLYPRHLLVRVLAFGALAGLFFFNVKADATGWKRASREQAEQALPESAGVYKLERRWYEDTAGYTVVVNGDYIKPGGAGTLTLGLWLQGDYHLAAWCRRIRGEAPAQVGQVTMRDATGMPVQFVTSYYDDGVSRHFDAESSCTSAGCDLKLTDEPEKGLKVTSPPLVSLMVKPLRRLPLFIRREWADDDTSVAEEEKEFEAGLRELVGHMDIKRLQASVQ
jgi:exosortase J